MDASVSAAALKQSLASATPPLVIDVRRAPAFLGSAYTIEGALRRDHQQAPVWGQSLPKAARVIVYCVHGHEVSQNACRELVAAGIDAKYLDGGIEHWREDGGAVETKPKGAPTRWITRERPKIDRIACPWLIRRFVDADAEFLYVPAADVRRIAQERDAVPYDVPDVAFTHEDERCSFDAFIRHYRLRDPALDDLATIVRGADTGRLDLAPQAAGLAAISLGLSRNFPDDHEMLVHGMTLYDALYAWCREGKSEAHTWNPAAIR